MKARDNIATSTLKFILVDLIGDVLYWPLWWYSKGLAQAGRFCIQSFQEESERLAIHVWLKNIFTPMFGQYDWEGRIISFFMRLIQLIVRSILLLLWALFLSVLVLTWTLLPVYISYQVFDNFLWFFG
ncbi:MAG: hypothetical protein A2744_03190 [Candidatus Buchananbacteria bacterium RIFCSPHIGHO2_01_FULL_44_11]|uniref:Uncharacterized protein n=1 Tax=Candidatus Buchananbacteria bacterium RIFCSPHIGHO2_01_FULL_44_11 TaxID=1797535 RepID=A0A1G1Y2B5_9BACT|nr:MAG: hypothetical protein A2744_03190 [Candidatus Buchananbacteria bacterium RIFCSPHIGHO2_01_FULL_44_11]